MNAPPPPARVGLDPLDVTPLVGESPAGVLLVDLATREVIHANPVAEQLAPGMRLPMPLESWSDAARLRDLEGHELSETDHPLTRVARSEPVAGQAVSAARASDLGGRRSSLWVVAFPLSGAPGLEGHALVVLLPLAGLRPPTASDDGAAAPLAGLDLLYGRAVRATSLSFTVADATGADQPLVWVNPAFTLATGYSFDEVVGRNCRFLQGPDTDPTAPGQMREAIAHGQPCRTTLLNYRKDGTPFWNQVDLSPVRDGEGVVTHYVGIQTDVTERMDAELALFRALRDETRARADAEAAQARLTFLVEAVNRLSGTLDIDRCTERLLQLVVPELADWALVLHVGDHQELLRVSAVHGDPARQGEVEELAGALPTALRPGSLVDVLLAGEPVRLIDLSEPVATSATRRGYLRDLSVADLTARLDGASAMCVALSGRSEVREVLALVRGPQRAPFADGDTSVGLDLGHRAGLIFDNARLYESQRLIAETLQRSLLPTLAPVDGLEVAARYHAGDQAAQVGGDFYDLMAYDDGSVGVAIGDVLGHDVLATAAMGHLKGMLRALAFTADEEGARPGVLLDRLDHLVSAVGIDTIATAAYLRLDDVDGTDGGGRRVQWASAGHPPPVLRLPDGTTELLEAAEPDLLLGAGGAGAGAARTTYTRVVPAGSTIVLYTDGLVEHRTRSLDTGLRALQRVVERLPSDAPATLTCHALFDAGIAGPTDDDVAVIVVRIPEADAAATVEA
jgi:PAS domain S-box-containing protein